MHGLIFETSIWLLAGSTRFLRINPQCFRTDNRIYKRIYIRWKMRHAEHERKEFYFHHTFSSNHNHDMQKHMPLIEVTWRSNKRFSTHYNSMRNSEFIKSTNTNSQTPGNSEELQDKRRLHFQLATAEPKEDATRTLNWRPFSMQRLTLQKPPAILLMSSSAALHIMGSRRTILIHSNVSPCTIGKPNK